MNPNITGLNHTGFGACSPERVSAGRSDLGRELVRAMPMILTGRLGLSIHGLESCL